MGDITSLAIASGDASKWSVEQMLEDALKEVREGKRGNRYAVLLTLDRGDGSDWNVGFHNAGLKTHEMLALVETFKIQIFEMMDLI